MELSELAQTGAAAIVGAMATDGWKELRRQLGQIFRRGEGVHADDVLDQIDDTHAAVETGTDPDASRYAQAELQGILKARLRDDAVLAAHFAALVAEVRESLGSSQQPQSIKQQARADRGSTVTQAGRDVINDPRFPRD